MNLNKSTRYALYAALELALARDDGPVTVGQIAGRYRIPEAVLAKAFQQLVRAGLALGTRGSGGGYRLARSPAEITVLDILQVFEPARTPEQCLLAEGGEPDCSEYDLCRLRRLFDEVDEMARSTFASVTLDTLAGGGNRPGRPLELAGRGR